MCSLQPPVKKAAACSGDCQPIRISPKGMEKGGITAKQAGL